MSKVRVLASGILLLIFSVLSSCSGDDEGFLTTIDKSQIVGYWVVTRFNGKPLDVQVQVEVTEDRLSYFSEGEMLDSYLYTLEEGTLELSSYGKHIATVRFKILNEKSASVWMDNMYMGQHTLKLIKVR